MAASNQLLLIEKNAKWIKERRDNNTISLNYKKYISEIEKNKERSKEFDAISDYQTKLIYTSLPYEEELKKADSSLLEKRNRWHKSLSQDVYVEEALHVLEDLKINNLKNRKVANIKD